MPWPRNGGRPPCRTQRRARASEPATAREQIRRTWLLFGLAATIIGFSVAPLLNDPLDRGEKCCIRPLVLRRAGGLAWGAIYPKGRPDLPVHVPSLGRGDAGDRRSLGPRLFVMLLVGANTVAWVSAIVLSVYLATGKLRWRPGDLYSVASFGCRGVHP